MARHEQALDPEGEKNRSQDVPDRKVGALFHFHGCHFCPLAVAPAILIRVASRPATQFAGVRQDGACMPQDTGTDLARSLSALGKRIVSTPFL